MDITSRDNRMIKEYRRLLGDTKYRRETARFVIEGARLCEDAVRSNLSIEMAFVTDRAARQYGEIVNRIRVAADTVYDIPDSLADHLADTDAPQGIFCICRMPAAPSLPEATGYFAALEQIRDPGNLGTMIRTAEALGLRGIFLSDACCDPYSPKVLRASMGGVFRLPLWTIGTFAEQLPRLHEKGFLSFACVVDHDAAAVSQTSFRDGSICVIGNEGNGLLPETVAACTQRITIPMVGRAESINASMAAGIVFWEMMRG